MRTRATAGATVLALWPGASLAHGMGGSVGYRLTLESMLDSIDSPIILLLLVGFGFVAGTGGLDRARYTAGFLLLGLVAGIPLAAALGPYGAVGGLVVGALCSLVAAAGFASGLWVLGPALGLAAGLASSIYNLDGHALAELPIAVHLGVVLGPLLLGLALTSWIAVLLDSNPPAWLRILFRIFSSWSFAANAIYLAFQVKSGG